MAKAGDRFEMPDGSVYTVTRPAAETGGEYVEMEFTLPPDCVAPPPHVHPSQTEEYEVVRGSFDVMVDGKWQTLGPGESASVPVGVIHTFRNRSGAAVHVRNWHRPAVRFEDYIEEINTTLREKGITSKRDVRIPLVLSALMLEYADTLAPGRAREGIPIRVFGALGKLLGLTRKPG